MKKFLQIWTMFIATMLVGFSAYAGFGAYQSTQNLGVFANIKCSTGVSCSKSGDKLNIVASGGAAHVQNLATATVVTAAQCGQSFYNAGAVAMTLPLASTVLGCRFTFITMNATNFDVRANAADQILTSTSAVGRAARNAVVGSVIIVQAVAANKYVTISTQGTWADTP